MCVSILAQPILRVLRLTGIEPGSQVSSPPLKSTQLSVHPFTPAPTPPPPLYTPLTLHPLSSNRPHPLTLPRNVHHPQPLPTYAATPPSHPRTLTKNLVKHLPTSTDHAPAPSPPPPLPPIPPSSVPPVPVHAVVVRCQPTTHHTADRTIKHPPSHPTQPASTTHHPSTRPTPAFTPHRTETPPHLTNTRPQHTPTTHVDVMYGTCGAAHPVAVRTVDGPGRANKC